MRRIGAFDEQLKFVSVGIRIELAVIQGFISYVIELI